MVKYDPQKVEKHWQEVWEKEGIYKASDFSSKKKYYLLVEYPYPSGEGLHMGHAFTNTIGDIYARYLRMNGYNLLFPMGWDSFGLPTENSAIKLGIHPAILTKRNTQRFKKQNQSLGLSFDWGREIDTSDPSYYRWTQWIFLQLFKAGLAYKTETKVGWCPKCKINLANEEIIAGKCERCGTKISYRNQKQWLLRITKYADRLVDELDLVDYPDYIKKAQRDWIGRKEWVDIEYPVEGIDEIITVSTTRPDTNFGATFVVIAPEHPLVNKILERENLPKKQKEEIQKYINLAKSKSELERISEGQIKTGVFTGFYAINRLNQAKLPIYITDFVLESVGTGAVVGVPGHDKRDFEFAQKFNLPVIRVVIGKDNKKGEINKINDVYEGEGVAVNSGFIDGMTTHKATNEITEYIKKKGWGKKVTRYHLRDWIFSRQHYWGEPIPIIHCPKCGMVPVPEDQLPVELPKVEKYQPTDTGESPLARISTWVNTICPSCGGKAQRETDTMPNWAGSSWYYLRFVDPKNQKGLADNKKLCYWMPVNCYIGGAEHTTLHLLYSRFWHKFLNNLKVVPGKEPYAARRQHGVILGEDGGRMSKSRGNVINPVEMVEKFGADALRLYLMFMGPYDSTMSWKTEGVEGMYRFLGRVWRLFQKKNSEVINREMTTLLHQSIKKVSEDIQEFKYNTAISSIMVLVNFLEKEGINSEAKNILCLLIAPFTPHLADEIWFSVLGNKTSIHLSTWPEYTMKLTQRGELTFIVQINGKVRSQIQIESEKIKDRMGIEKLAKTDPKISKWLKGKKVKKVIFVPGKLINFVV